MNSNPRSSWLGRLWPHVSFPAVDASGASRIQFLDAIRAYAILAMLIGHVVGVVMDERYKHAGNLLYRYIRLIEGNAAAVFIFASGLVVSYLLFKDGKKMNLPRAKKAARRGLHLVVLGYVLQISVVNLWNFVSAPSVSILDFLLRSHILHTLGLGIIAVAGLYFITSRMQPAFLVLAFILANACFFFGPYLSLHAPDDGAFRIIAIFIRKPYAYFPLFPWLGFTLFGACIGYLAARQNRFMSLIVFIALIALGYIVRNSSWYILNWTYGLALNDYAELLKEGGFTYYRLGEVLIICGFAGAICRYVVLPAFFLKSGEESLSIYFLHSVVVYGSITNFGLNKLWRHELPPLETGIIVAVVTLLFMLYGVYAARLREKLPFLRFIK